MLIQDQWLVPASVGHQWSGNSSVTNSCNKKLIPHLDCRFPAGLLFVEMFVENWADFKRAAETVYLQDPDKVRCCLKYDHVENALIVKFTDDEKTIQYKTDQFNEYKQLETFIGELMTQMAVK